ncbi:hypothetical protein HX109_10705 [Galbibacter sp. BG1]|uniref:hypothetical protein n=1 Tax=Galbibacter sp. BG1 TaxID=1170699 RepID=UPI0015C19739|nr:hypothetical protein [Galbibacter sp. BG1]QLE02000.1 hypothetical protein HX109_10705 [Galbibacter sp. BG1]
MASWRRTVSITGFDQGDMNYIKHLNRFMEYVRADKRMNPSHISLYLAYFHLWNVFRFPEEFFVSRNEVMEVAKIGSPTTYHRNLKELDRWHYLKYTPSKTRYKGSRIQMYNFCTSTVQPVNLQSPKNELSTGHEVVPNINIKKHNKHYKRRRPKNKNSLVLFFKGNGGNEKQALKFFNYYERLGWCTADEKKIKDWQGLALKWMAGEGRKGRENYLHIENEKDYSKPL